MLLWPASKANKVAQLAQALLLAGVTHATAYFLYYCRPCARRVCSVATLCAANTHYRLPACLTLAASCVRRSNWGLGLGKVLPESKP